ncbi:MAG: ABC transporter transmembrane domain-containing protein, partial [Propionicimonas sp.]|nr:ABC transporter transmembrane domain-containing protein [Propionicimonas sp.]
MSAAGSRRELARWLVGHTRALLAPLSIAVVARIANQVLGIVLLVQVAQAFADAAAGRAPALPGLLGLLVVVALAKALLRYLEHYAGHFVAFTSLARLRELFFARLVPQAPAATQGRAGAELTDRATRDIDRIEVFFAHTLPPAVAAVVVPGLALGWLAAAVDGRLALVIAGFVVMIGVVVPLLSGRATWRGSHRVAARRGRLAAHLGDDLQGVREVLGFGIQRARLAGLADADDALTGARLQAGRVDGIRAATLLVLELLTLVAVVTAGSAAGLPPAAVAVALAVAVGLWAPARGVDDFVTGLDAAFAAAARVREVTDAPPLVRDPKRPRPIPAAIPSTSAATPTSGVLDAGVPDSAGGRPTPSSGVLDAGVPDSAGGRPTPPGTPPAAEPAAVEVDQVTFSYPGA